MRINIRRFLATAIVGNRSCEYKEKRLLKDKVVTFDPCLTNREDRLQDFNNACDEEEMSRLIGKRDSAAASASTQRRYAKQVRDEEAKVYLELCDKAKLSAEQKKVLKVLCDMNCSQNAKPPSLESLGAFEEELSEETKNALTLASRPTYTPERSREKSKFRYCLTCTLATAIERDSKNKSGKALAAKLREDAASLFWSTKKGSHMTQNSPGSPNWFDASMLPFLASSFSQLEMVDEVDESSEMLNRVKERVRNFTNPAGPPDATAADVAWNGKDIEYKMFVRSSPNLITWLSQVFTLLYAFFVMVYVWVLHPGCNVNLDRNVYFSHRISRHEENVSAGCMALLMSIDETPPDVKVCILVQDIDRLGVDPEYASKLIELLEHRPNTQLISLRQYGMNLLNSLQIVAEYSQRKHRILKASDHTNAGKSIPIDKDAEDELQAITDKKEVIYDSLRDESSEESKVVCNAHLLGDTLLKSFEDSSSAEAMVNDLAEAVTKVDDGQCSPEEAAKALKESYGDKELSAEFVSTLDSLPNISLIQTRSSRSIHTSSTCSRLGLTREGVQMDQVSYGLAASQHYDTTKTLLCIIREFRINRTEVTTRYALAMILLLVFNGKVDSIYTKTLVRMSSSLSMIQICLSAFKDHDVSFKPVDCTGKKLLSVAKAEVKRALDLSIALQNKHDAEFAEVANLSDSGRQQYYDMRGIGRMNWGSHVKFIGDGKSKELGWNNEDDDDDDERKLPANKKKKT